MWRAAHRKPTVSGQTVLVHEVRGRLGKGDRGAGHGRPEQGRDCPSPFGVVRGGGQLRRGRVLSRWRRPPSGVRRQQAL